jgi:hypothetical protein
MPYAVADRLRGIVAEGADGWANLSTVCSHDVIAFADLIARYRVYV